MDIKQGFANTTLGKVNYLICGDPCLPKLVLLHQAPSSAEMYRLLMAQLSNDFCCIAPDFIGFGNSELIADVDHSIENYADSVMQCLQHLDVQDFYLFGHHTGASVATYIAAHHQDVCKQLILSGPTLLPDELRAKLPDLVVPINANANAEELEQTWQKFRNKDATVSEHISKREFNSAVKLGTGYKSAYQAVCAQDVAQQLSSITCSTLVFAGDRDVLQPYVDDALAVLTQGEKIEIGDCSTYVCETHPERVAKVIKEFIR
ncbi:alpha/beta fold hydrolase [Thalassomonas sp. M1454]|uniref:alpha/beta fold hydrolase n=1 Tax=Thalassomonas sp. M1454 TaxID=2594477 RepID=UPI00117FD58B|nr:alpha/beta hydrolase [Thalassomonas sp. M1454]TRX55016.1 alpha/beta hydrolase [Thalassomonas sp. M1454]